jgi:hypothetical protein
MSKPELLEKEQVIAEQTRRQFIKKFGKFAAVTPVAVTALMSPSTSAAPKSCKGNNKTCRQP